MLTGNIEMGTIEKIRQRIADWIAPRVETPIHKMTGRDLQWAFKDLLGQNYYHIDNSKGIGFEHYGKAMEFTMFMSAGLSGKEITTMIEFQEEVLENMVAGKKGSLSILGAVNTEMKNRKNLVIHTELLYNFVACHYIREDESPKAWDEQIHNEKVEAFKAMLKADHPYGFFFQFPELKNLTKISTDSPEKWNSWWNESMRQLESLPKKIDYLRSMQSSVKDKLTPKRASGFSPAGMSPKPTS